MMEENQKLDSWVIIQTVHKVYQHHSCWENHLLLHVLSHYLAWLQPQVVFVTGCLHFWHLEKRATSQPVFHHVGPVAPEIFNQIAIYNNPQFTTAVCVIHLPTCPNAFPLFLKRNRIMGGLGQDSSIFFPPSLPNKRSHFNSCFHPSRPKIQFHDHLAARAMFNNSQLCSQAPSPQREPHHAAWTAAGPLLCVCSVTLISSMNMFPHLSRLQRQDLCCCINNTAWYCPGGSLLCVSGSSLFSPICYAVYPNMERGAFPGPACGGRTGAQGPLALTVWEKRTPY